MTFFCCGVFGMRTECIKMMIIIMMFFSITCILIFTLSKKKNKKAAHANVKKKKERLHLKFHNIIPEMDKGKTVGHFAPSSFVQQNISRLEEWEEDQKTKLKWISCFYKKRLNFLAPSLNEIMLKEAKENNIPDISDCKFDKLESESPFVNKLIFTVDRFENCIHLDNDKSTYAFGIFLPIFKNSGKLASF